ncbi:MAG: hypothetical protein EXR72_18765 [Myxococcales bacterium]|nr:hypothetical protein [Myxococcales bacterium]
MSDESDRKTHRTPYAKYAFANAYNLSLLAGTATVAMATQNWFLGVAAVGAEALWMLFAPGSKILRRIWFDKRHAEKLFEEERQRIATIVATLPADEAVRCVGLRTKKEQIDRMCAENPAFTADLLRNELAKLDQLVRSFVDMASACVRYLDYLRTIDLDGIEKDIRRYSHIVDNVAGDDKERRQIALKNLGVLQARKAKVAEIRGYLVQMRGQQDLIDNTFKLLADQILTMRSPQELTGQLDELMDGVEAVRQTARDTDRLMQAIER